MALLFIIIGAVFDFFDGMSARLLGVSSPIGKELDSLADDITSGFAPSAIVFGYLSTLHIHLPFVPFLAFIMAAFSALRLAKFNLDERQALGFIGLPTPANALFWGALIVGLQQNDIYFEGMEWVIIVATFVSSYLLIAEIPMFALKFKHWGFKGNEVKYIFVLSCIPLLLFLGVSGFAAIIASHAQGRCSVYAIGRRLGISYLRMLSYSRDLYALRDRGLIRLKGMEEIVVPAEVIDSIMRDKPFEKPQVEGLSTRVLLRRIQTYLTRVYDGEYTPLQFTEEVDFLLSGHRGKLTHAQVNII